MISGGDSDPELHFDQTSLALQFDRHNRTQRIGVPASFAVFFGTPAVLAAIKYQELIHRTVNWWILGFIFAVCWGAGILLLIQTPHLFWRQRRAARSITIRQSGIELSYPEGITVRFEWSTPGLLFMLYDMSTAPSFRKLDFATFFIGDRDRCSPLWPGVYREILNRASKAAVVRSVEPQRFLMFPGLFIPVNWSVSGKAPG